MEKDRRLVGIPRQRRSTATTNSVVPNIITLNIGGFGGPRFTRNAVFLATNIRVGIDSTRRMETFTITGVIRRER